MKRASDARDETTLPAPASLDDASRWPFAALLETYRQLPAPAPGELDGEYSSTHPADREPQMRAFFRTRGRGQWLGKAYRPAADQASGEGYNMWGRHDAVQRSERFSWRLGPSTLDGRPALLMRYADFRNESGAVGLIDEIRVVRPGLYLGLYRTRIAVPPFTRTQGSGWSDPEMFVLEGPLAPWRGVDDDSAETGRWGIRQRVIRTATAPRAIRPLLSRLVGPVVAASVAADLPARRAGVGPVVMTLLFRLPPALRQRLAGRSVTIQGQTLDRDLQLLLRLSRLLPEPAPWRSARALVRSRRGLTRSARLVAGPRLEGVSVRELTVAGADTVLPARLYTPASGAQSIVVYLHGGGWVLGGLGSHDALCRQLCLSSGARILSVEYRKAPENPGQVLLADALAAYRDVVARAEGLGARPGDVAVAGDSAGAALAARVAWHAARDGLPVRAQLLIYPVTDCVVRRPSRDTFATGFHLKDESIDYFIRTYAPTAAERDQPDVSPIYEQDLTGLPPAIVVTAGFDPLRDEGDAYAERLRASGVPVRHLRFPSMTHAFANMLCLPSAREANLQIGAALRETLE